MKRTLLVLTFLTILALSATDLLAGGTIRGKITDKQEGLSLSGARVTLSNSNLGGVTNKSGEFTILNVPVGNYDLNVK